jgi:hypothetical protein
MVTVRLLLLRLSMTAIQQQMRMDCQSDDQQSMSSMLAATAHSAST